MTTEDVWAPLQRLRDAYAKLDQGDLDPIELELSALLEVHADDRQEDGFQIDMPHAPKDWGEAAVLAAKLLARKAEALMPSPKGASELDAEEAAAASDEDSEELDPEALARRLAAYEAFRDVADHLREFESEQRQRFGPGWPPPELKIVGKPPNLELNVLIEAFQTLWERGKGRVERVQAEVYTMAHARKDILSRLEAAHDACLFYDLFAESQTRIRLVVMFLCLLELLRLREVTYRQDEDGSIWIVREGNKGDDVVARTT